jgi:hypothetical protein
LNLEVGGGHDNAVGGEFVTRLELDDISDDELPDRDGLELATLAT